MTSTVTPTSSPLTLMIHFQKGVNTTQEQKKVCSIFTGNFNFAAQDHGYSIAQASLELKNNTGTLILHLKGKSPDNQEIKEDIQSSQLAAGRAMELCEIEAA